MYLIIYAENGMETHYVSNEWTPEAAISELYATINGSRPVDAELFQRMISGLGAEDAARVFNAITDMHIERMFHLLGEVDIYGGLNDNLQDNK